MGKKLDMFFKVGATMDEVGDLQGVIQNKIEKTEEEGRNIVTLSRYFEELQELIDNLEDAWRECADVNEEVTDERFEEIALLVEEAEQHLESQNVSQYLLKHIQAMCDYILSDREIESFQEHVDEGGASEDHIVYSAAIIAADLFSYGTEDTFDYKTERR